MAKKIEDKQINVQPTSNRFYAQAAAIDVALRNRAALANHPDFFNNAAHVKKVDMVKKIAANFFRVRENIYVNYRVNKGDKFTAVKVHRPDWPNVTNKTANIKFRRPLKRLGVELVRGVDSYVLRVR